jgi:hypothetical protein
MVIKLLLNRGQIGLQIHMKTPRLNLVIKQKGIYMSDQSKQTPKAAPAYPDKTVGSETADAVRKAGNQWTEQQRADLFKRGMQIIYGGAVTKEKVLSR